MGDRPLSTYFKRKTAANRFARALHAVSQWCKRNRHQPVAEQYRTLSQKLRGHFGYYRITGNSSALSRFRMAVQTAWRKWLSRRKRGGLVPWTDFNRLLERYPLPPPIAVHSVCRQQRTP